MFMTQQPCMFCGHMVKVLKGFRGWEAIQPIRADKLRFGEFHKHCQEVHPEQVHWALQYNDIKDGLGEKHGIKACVQSIIQQATLEGGELLPMAAARAILIDGDGLPLKEYICEVVGKAKVMVEPHVRKVFAKSAFSKTALAVFKQDVRKWLVRTSESLVSFNFHLLASCLKQNHSPEGGHLENTLWNIVMTVLSHGLYIDPRMPPFATLPPIPETGPQKNPTEQKAGRALGAHPGRDFELLAKPQVNGIADLTKQNADLQPKRKLLEEKFELLAKQQADEIAVLKKQNADLQSRINGTDEVQVMENAGPKRPRTRSAFLPVKVKVENQLEGEVRCPHKDCAKKNLGLIVGEKGCNIVTCRNHKASSTSAATASRNAQVEKLQPATAPSGTTRVLANALLLKGTLTQRRIQLIWMID